jgi:colicin import membrane protein
MDLATDTLERIFAAADSLYEQAGCSGFPTVDAVRKTARVNMNDASVGMKRWRRAHTLPAVPMAAQVPEGVRQAGAITLAALWRDAQQVAVEGFRGERAAWDTERAEAETLHMQLADAFEAQASELDATTHETRRLRAEAGDLLIAKAGADVALRDARRDLVLARAAGELSDARADEIGRRAGELRTELDYAHQEIARARTEFEHIDKKRAAEVGAVRQASSVALAKAEGERDTAMQEASDAREITAALRGQLDAAREQNMALMQLVAMPHPT